MEPVTLAGIFLVVVGGGMYLDSSDEDLSDKTAAQVEEVREYNSESQGFARGVFIRTESGYYISNLSPEPVTAEGCDQPVLVADLSQPRSKETRDVSPVMVDCEG